MDEQFLHILVPIYSSQAQGKIFHTNPPAFLPKTELVCETKFSKFHRGVQDGQFWLLSNTICLCLLNLGIGLRLAIKSPYLAELQQLSITAANAKLRAAS